MSPGLCEFLKICLDGKDPVRQPFFITSSLSFISYVHHPPSPCLADAERERGGRQGQRDKDRDRDRDRQKDRLTPNFCLPRTDLCLYIFLSGSFLVSSGREPLPSLECCFINMAQEMRECSSVEECLLIVEPWGPSSDK